MQYDRQLAGLPGLSTPCCREGSTHVWHQYTLKIAAGQRDALAKALADMNIATCVYYPVANHRQHAFREAGSPPTVLPVTEKLESEVLSLPMHAALRPYEVACIAAAVQQFALKAS